MLLMVQVLLVNLFLIRLHPRRQLDDLMVIFHRKNQHHHQQLPDIQH
jgi:hypothetical protein